MRANQAGGLDNITVVVADVQSTHPADEARDEIAQELSQMNIHEDALERDRS